MPRRAHRKSRNGCVECKRRHVKCDEKRPQCSNCTVSARSCEYAEPFRRAVVGPSGLKQPSSRTSEGSSSTPSPSIPSLGISPATSVPSPTPQTSLFAPDPPANMLHFSLLHHLYTETLPSLDQDLVTKPAPPELIHTVYTTPYLLNELLAISALHESTTQSDPSEKSLYRHHAAQLQTHALAIFNADAAHLTVTPHTCVPLFLFASCLATHMLCDTLVFRDTNDFDALLDRFVTHLGLYRGVRAITRQAWSMLRESSLRSHLLISERQFTRAHDQLDPPCRRLLDRIEAARLGPELTGCYAEAVQALQTAMSAAEGGSSNGAYSWPVLVGVEYMDLVTARRPEALVVLAHYAVLLHEQRGVWVFGDGGRFLVEQIGGYLGVEWEEWLEWPMSRIQGE